MRESLVAVGLAVGEATGSRWGAVGAVLFGAVSLYVAGRGLGVATRTRKWHALVAVVSGVTSASYVLLLAGGGTVSASVPGGEPTTIYWARHAAWLVTVPLLVSAVGSVAGADRQRLGSAVAATVFATATTLAAMLSGVGGYRYVWVGVALLAFGDVVSFLGGTLRAGRRRTDAETTATVAALGTVLCVGWVGHPLWWLVGSGGLGAVSPAVETVGFLALDLVATVGFGVVLLRSPAVLGPPPATPEQPGDQARRLT